MTLVEIDLCVKNENLLVIRLDGYWTQSAVDCEGKRCIYTYVYTYTQIPIHTYLHECMHTYIYVY